MPGRVWEKAAAAVAGCADRRLHRLRRSAALKMLDELRPIESLVFVCKGNICRSPFAEALFVALLPEWLRGGCRVSSAGLWGADRPSPDEALRVASTYGIDLTGHRSRTLSREILEGVDLVVVMSSEQMREVVQRFDCPSRRVLILGDLDPEPIKERTIIDPWSHSEAVFEASYARIHRTMEVLVGGVVRGHRGAGAVVEAKLEEPLHEEGVGAVG